MDPEIVQARRFMQEKILLFLAQRQPQTAEIPQRRIFDLVKRLEEGLYRTATTQEEYLNLETLESRLHAFVKPQHGNSNMISSTDNSTVTPSTGNTISSSSGNNTYMLPTENGSSGGMHAVSNGSLSNGYQQGTNVDRVE